MSLNAWRITVAAVLGYESIAGLSKTARRKGLSDDELPFLTEIIRPLPLPIRVGLAVAVGLMTYDHLNEDERRRHF